MSECIETLKLHSNQTVLDVGCGCGEVLIRLWERYGIHGTGIDSAAESIAEANRRAKSRAPADAIQFLEEDARTFFVAPETVDLVLCLGASHAFALGGDAYQAALEQIAPWIVPGGLLLVGEGYMKRPAPPEYRKLLGERLPDDKTHLANIAVAEKMGLCRIADWTSSQEEWDDFEWTYQRFVVLNAIEHPHDAEAQRKLARRHEWMDAYLRWGRDTLGYAMYLFSKR